MRQLATTANRAARAAAIPSHVPQRAREELLAVMRRTNLTPDDILFDPTPEELADMRRALTAEQLMPLLRTDIENKWDRARSV